MNFLAQAFFTFAMYQPGPVILLGDLYLRGTITLSDGSSQFCLVMPTDALVYSVDEALEVVVHIKKDLIQLAGKNSLNSGLGNCQMIRHERSDSFKQLNHKKNGQIISLNGDCLKDTKAISLEADTAINLDNVTMISPFVALFAKKYNFNNYSCNANSLVIVSTDPNSLYESIQFIFDEQIEGSGKIFGKIDFEADSGDFIVSGVKTIKIHFSKKAFSSQDGNPIPEIKPGGKIF